MCISGLGDGVTNGVWERMHQYFIDEPDMEYLIIDRTTVRAHPCDGGASSGTGGNNLRRSAEVKGGFSTNIHVSLDGLGNR